MQKVNGSLNIIKALPCIINAFKMHWKCITMLFSLSPVLSNKFSYHLRYLDFLGKLWGKISALFGLWKSARRISSCKSCFTTLLLQVLSATLFSLATLLNAVSSSDIWRTFPFLNMVSIVTRHVTLIRQREHEDVSKSWMNVIIVVLAWFLSHGWKIKGIRFCSLVSIVTNLSYV